MFYVTFFNMVNLLFAKWATIAEIDEFHEAIKKRNAKEYEKSLAYLESKKTEIMNAYHDLLDKYQLIFDSQKKERLLKITAYRDGKCTCGATPVFREGLNFWGCPNYRDKSKIHYNYVGYDYSYEEINQIVDLETYYNYSTWVTTLKHSLSLPKSIKTHSLYKFIMDNDGVCLSEMFAGESVENKLNNYRESSKRGVYFEHEFKEIAEKKHKKVYYQHAIKYQYWSREYKFAIPDFIAIDDDTITIYECKINSDLIDDRQRALYMDLVSFIMKEKNINKELLFYYVYKDENDNIVIDEPNSPL